MKLDHAKRRILLTVQFDSEMHVPEISKRTGIQTHNVHYHLRKLKEAGIIRRGAYIDLFALGFSEYEILFSVGSASATLRRDLLRFLSTHPRIIWFAELGGRFRYGFTLCAKHVGEALFCLDELEKKFGRILQKKSVSQVVRRSAYKKKYLLNDDDAFASIGKAAQSIRLAPKTLDLKDSLDIQHSSKAIKLDQLDWQIISFLFHSDFETHQDIARGLGAPRATVEYRLRNLEKLGAILRHIYFISASKFGMLVFKLLVYSRGIRSDLTRTLSSFVAEEPSIVGFIQCFGTWDYELNAEVHTTEEVVSLSEKLYAKFQDTIQDIEILPVFSQSTSQGFLSKEHMKEVINA